MLIITYYVPLIQPFSC